MRMLAIIAKVAAIVCLLVILAFAIDESPSLWQLHDEQEHREWYK